MKAAAAPALITKSFTPDEIEFLAAMIGDFCENTGPCHCDRDPNCQACAVLRSIVKTLGPIAGVCRFCLCTPNQACQTEEGPCFWEDEEQTICSNPACIQEAEKELGIGALNKARRA